MDRDLVKLCVGLCLGFPKRAKRGFGRLTLGRPTKVSVGAACSILGASGLDKLGWSFAVGNFNGDGVNDLAIDAAERPRQLVQRFRVSDRDGQSAPLIWNGRSTRGTAVPSGVCL